MENLTAAKMINRHGHEAAEAGCLKLAKKFAHELEWLLERAQNETEENAIVNLINNLWETILEAE